MCVVDRIIIDERYSINDGIICDSDIKQSYLYRRLLSRVFPNKCLTFFFSQSILEIELITKLIVLAVELVVFVLTAERFMIVIAAVIFNSLLRSLHIRITFSKDRIRNLHTH